METLTKERRSIDGISDKYFKEAGQTLEEEEIIYPDSDGEPMADNTKQFDWIVKVKENLEIMYADNPLVFVGGDLLWYPVKGNNDIRRAPDAMVVFGRPKGYRGSYQTWKEVGIVPQVVFEILSPGNTTGEMAEKFDFYDKYGVEEYYLYDPDKIILNGWIRSGIHLKPIKKIDGWISPRLIIRFDMSGEELEIFRPDGQRFLSPVEFDKKFKSEHQRAEQEHQRAEQEHQRAEKMAAALKKRGINPDTI